MGSRVGIDGGSSAKHGAAVVTERGMQDQLLCLQLRPESGGHFVPVDVFIFGTVSSPRCDLQNSNIRKSVHKLPVFRHFSAAICACPNVTLGLAHIARRKPMQALPGLRSRRHKSIKFSVVDMFIEWTGQSLTLPI